MPEHLEAVEVVTQRSTPLLQNLQTYLKDKIGFEEPITSRFQLNGAPLVSEKALTSLPEPIQSFFLKGRVMSPSQFHVFSDPNTGSVHMRANNDMLALRGIRYYGIDNKYHQALREQNQLQEEPIEILQQNITDDLSILDQLIKEDYNDTESWLAQVGAWGYIYNDIASYYYLKKCQQALTGQDIGVEEIARLLQSAANSYFDSFLLRGIQQQDYRTLQESLPTVHSDLLELEASRFISDSSDLEVLRSERELDLTALLSAFHLVYRTDKVTSSDVVVTPLFGGIDMYTTLNYVYARGDEIRDDLKMFNSLQKKINKPPIIPVLYRFMGVNGHNRFAPGYEEKEITVPQEGELHDRLQSVSKVLVVDDSVGRFREYEKFVSWLRAFAGSNGEELDFDIVAARGSLRWAEGDNIPYHRYLDAEIVRNTPLCRSYRGEKRQYSGVPYLPQWFTWRGLLKEEQT